MTRPLTPLSQASALNPEFYTRDDVYAFELAEIIRPNWQVIAPASSVAGIGEMISTAGALNGTIFVAGQMPMAVALDGLAPKILSKRNSGGTQTLSLLMGAALASVLLVGAKLSLCARFYRWSHLESRSVPRVGL